MDPSTQGSTPAASTDTPYYVANPSGDSSSSWATATQGAQPPQTQSDSLDGASIDGGEQQQQAMQPPPKAVSSVQAPPPTATRVPRKGIGGFIDKMVDSLAGTDTSRIRTDPDGNLFIQHETPTRGQQWLKIAGEAIEGGAAGLASGNKGKAAEAGIQAAKQSQAAQTQQEKDQKLEVANSQMMKHQLAAQAFEMDRKKIEAGEHDITFSQNRTDWIKNNGGEFAGHAPDLPGLTKIMRATPDFGKDQAEKDIFEPVQAYTADGKPNGFNLYRMSPGWGDEVEPAGSLVHFWNPLTHAIEEQHTSQPMKKKDINSLDIAAGNASDKYKLDDAHAQEAVAHANELNHPTAKPETQDTIDLHHAEAERDRSEAGLARARAKQVKSGQLNDDGTPNPRFEAMAQSLYNGDITPADLKREAKGAALDPNDLMGRAIEIGQANGKPFSEETIKQESKFAGNEKTQAVVKGIDRILGAPGQAGYMDQMLNLARQAHLQSGAAAGAINPVILSVQRFLGQNAAKQLNTSIDDTRSAIFGLIGNPLVGGGETDQKLKQAHEMLGENPTMANLEGASKVLKAALLSQRRSIVDSNRYLRRSFGATAPAEGQQPQQGQSAVDNSLAGPIQPSEKAFLNRNTGHMVVVRGGKYVDPTTGQEVK